jgi:hypothetical protein
MIKGPERSAQASHRCSAVFAQAAHRSCTVCRKDFWQDGRTSVPAEMFWASLLIRWNRAVALLGLPDLFPVFYILLAASCITFTGLRFLLQLWPHFADPLEARSRAHRSTRPVVFNNIADCTHRIYTTKCAQFSETFVRRFSWHR